MRTVAAALLLAVAGSAGPAAAAVCPAITSRASMNVLVPAYVYPSGTGVAATYWNKILADAAVAKKVGFSLIVVVDPSNGEFTAVDPNYTTIVDRLDAAGALVVGYVHTLANGRDRPAADLIANITAWRAFYPKVRGIFFDEVRIDSSHFAYYRQLRQTVLQQFGGGAVTIGNAHGDQLADARYRDVFDVAVAFEGTGASLTTFGQQPMVRYAAPRDIAYIVNTVRGYAATSAQARACDILKSLRYSKTSVRNAGTWYLTTATGDAAYQTLGGEHDAMMAATCWANSLAACPK